MFLTTPLTAMLYRDWETGSLIVTGKQVVLS